MREAHHLAITGPHQQAQAAAADSAEAARAEAVSAEAAVRAEAVSAEAAVQVDTEDKIHI